LEVVDSMATSRALQRSREKAKKRGLPQLQYLNHWMEVCRYLDGQPYRSVRAPFPDDPPMSYPLLRNMARFNLVRHRNSDCLWQLNKRWQYILHNLMNGIKEQQRQEKPEEMTGSPFVVDYGVDTMYVNVLAEEVPTRLLTRCQQLKEQAQIRYVSVETPWSFHDAPLSMLPNGKAAAKGNGVSWGFILRNKWVEIRLRKKPVSGIVAVVHFLAECLWLQGAEQSLDLMQQALRAMWADAEAFREVSYQLSQIHLCADIAHFPLTTEHLPRLVMHSIKRTIHAPSRADLELDDSVFDAQTEYSDDDDLLYQGTTPYGWDEGDDLPEMDEEEDITDDDEEDEADDIPTLLQVCFDERGPALRSIAVASLSGRDSEENEASRIWAIDATDGRDADAWEAFLGASLEADPSCLDVVDTNQLTGGMCPILDTPAYWCAAPVMLDGIASLVVGWSDQPFSAEQQEALAELARVVAAVRSPAKEQDDDENEETTWDAGGSQAHWHGQRIEGFSFSPTGAMSAAWYDKILEERKSRKGWMREIHKAGGWQEGMILTRLEYRHKRPIFNELEVALGHEKGQRWYDDPYEALRHLQDLWGFDVGLPPEHDHAPDVTYRGWMRLAVPENKDINRSRWKTDPLWEVVQRVPFSQGLPKPLKRVKQAMLDQEGIDVEIRGLLISRAVARGAYRPGPAVLARELEDFEDWATDYEQKRPGVSFAEEVRERARMKGLPVPYRAPMLLPAKPRGRKQQQTNEEGI
jgi:hypothetical protein